MTNLTIKNIPPKRWGGLAVRTEHGHFIASATCSKCGTVKDWRSKVVIKPASAIKRARRHGWQMGKVILCRSCTKGHGSEEVDTSLEPKHLGFDRWFAVDRLGDAKGGPYASREEALRHIEAGTVEMINGGAAEAPMERKEQSMEQVKPQASEAAKKAKRMVYMALEDYYDDTAKRYKPGYSDQLIAKEIGVAVAVVARIREEDFGPVGEPHEIAKVREGIAKVREEIDAAERKLRSATALHDALLEKLEDIVAKNGWRS